MSAVVDGETLRTGRAATGALDLTVVIVNYNVRYFLEQCLHSVRAATATLRAEVIVVDNASHDDSLQMLAERFADVTVVANARNVGFARANNQAIRRARGRYVLLLNPDTLVPEDCFERCLAYADAHPRCGVLGVPMFDGAGRYLPESKRGFPSPWVSFAKMSGLARLGPHSAQLNGYYAGHLPADETHVVDVLAGAFMWLRAEALTAAGGGLDEDYFMYGEDIDLSYCVQRAGYEVVYFAGTTIVHYKGESTRKRSLGYVRTFYRAMDIFARKHVDGPMGGAYRGSLRAAIYARAALAVVTNALAALALVLLDTAAVLAIVLGVKWAWANVRYGVPNWFEPRFDYVNVPVYTALIVAGVALGGGYDKPYRLASALRGAALGTLFTLIAYALLPEGLRSSRAVVLLTGAGALFVVPALRWGWSLLRPREVATGLRARDATLRLAVVGSPDEVERVLALLARAGVAREYIGRIAPDSPASATGEDELGALAELGMLARTYRLDEVVFCTRDVGVGAVVSAMRTYGQTLDCRTVAAGARAIVGSPSSSSPGELYTVGVRYEIALARRRRQKRTLDLAVASLVLALWPVLALLVDSPGGLARNALGVLLGSTTWVGYAASDAGGGQGLPQLRPAVLHLGGPIVDGVSVADEATPNLPATRLNRVYARLYRPADDLRTLRSRWRELGATPLAIARLAPSRWPHWAAAAPSVYREPHAR